MDPYSIIPLKTQQNNAGEIPPFFIAQKFTSTVPKTPLPKDPRRPSAVCWWVPSLLSNIPGRGPWNAVERLKKHPVGSTPKSVFAFFFFEETGWRMWRCVFVEGFLLVKQNGVFLVVIYRSILGREKRTHASNEVNIRLMLDVGCSDCLILPQ